MSTTTTTAPELTSEQVVKVLTLPLEQASTFLASGPKIYDSAGPLRIPSLGGPVTDPGWTGEAEQIPLRDAEFGEVELLPSTLKSVKVICKFSAELARQSVVSLDSALKSRLVTDVAAKIDAQFWGSAGDGITTPQGILAWPDSQEVEYTPGAEVLDSLTDMWGLALSANVSLPGLRWVMRPETFVRLRKVKEGSNSMRPILQPDVTQDAVFRLFGSPVTITSRLPKDEDGSESVVLADFSTIAVARDLAPSVKVLTERYADTDELALRVVARYDVKPTLPEAVVVLRGVTA